LTPRRDLLGANKEDQMQLRRLELALLPVIGFALWGGCDQQEMMTPPQPEESAATGATMSDNDLLVELKVKENHSVRFYGRPSSIFVVENLPREERPAVGTGKLADALEMYKALRPGEEVPRALRDAHERARLAPPATRVKTPAEVVASGRSALAEVGTFYQYPVGAGSSNPAAFVNSHGGCMWYNINSTCKVSWANGYHSGNAYSTNMRCVVDHYSGDGVTVRSNYTGGAQPFWHAPNTLQIYYEFGSGSDTRSCELVGASGDGFHAGTQWF
jgi:hypothetical protein